jgi:acetyltransferase-like isoleucine patch superfamily enzyme
MFKLTFARYLIQRLREEYALCYRRYSFPGAERVHRSAIVLRDPWCEISIGEGSTVEHGTVMLARNERPEPMTPNSHIRIGCHSYIGQYNNLRTGGGSIDIGDHVAIAQFVSLIASGHGTTPGIPIHLQPVPTKRNIRMGDDVWIGAGSVILPGVSIGSGAVIGAGSIVTKDVAANTIMAGNPARVLRTR